MDLIKTYSSKHVSILSAVASHVKEVLVLSCSVDDLLNDLEYLHKCVSSVRVKWQSISKGIGITGREAYRWYNEVHVRKLFRGIMTSSDRQALQEIILAGIYDKTILLPNFRKVARTKLSNDYPLQIFTMTYNNLLRSKTVREALIYEKVILPMRTSAAQPMRSPSSFFSSTSPSTSPSRMHSSMTSDMNMNMNMFASLPPLSELQPLPPLPSLEMLPSCVAPLPSVTQPSVMNPQNTQSLTQPPYNLKLPDFTFDTEQAGNWPNPLLCRPQVGQADQTFSYPYQQPCKLLPFQYQNQNFGSATLHSSGFSSAKPDTPAASSAFVQDSNSSYSGASIFDEIVNKSDNTSALLSSSIVPAEQSASPMAYAPNYNVS